MRCSSFVPLRLPLRLCVKPSSAYSYHATLFHQKLFKGRGRKCLAEKKSLHRVTPERAEILKLFLRLHTLRNHREIEGVTQVDDRAHDRGVVRVFANVGHESLIDLQRIDRKAFQVVERRVAGAE